jgi:hypothetical protein
MHRSGIFPKSRSRCPNFTPQKFELGLSLIHQISLYGLLDQQSWRENYLTCIGRTENAIALAGLRACMALYRSDTGVFENRLTIMDIVDRIDAYPRTLIVGACRDLLVTSSHAAYRALAERGFDVHLKLYDARHGFFGFPPSWTFGAWRESAQPASRMMVSFLESERRRCTLSEGESCCTPCDMNRCVMIVT